MAWQRARGSWACAPRSPVAGVLVDPWLGRVRWFIPQQRAPGTGVPAARDTLSEHAYHATRQGIAAPEPSDSRARARIGANRVGAIRSAHELLCCEPLGRPDLHYGRDARGRKTPGL